MASATVIAFPSCVTQLTNATDFEVGLQLYTVRDALSADLIGTLRKVAEIGYKKIESAGYADAKIYGYSGSEFKKMIGDLGLEHVSAHIPLEHFRGDFDAVLALAQSSGQQYIVLPWLNDADRSSIDQYKAYAELLNQRGEEAKREGLTVCYHNHDFEFRMLDGELPIDILLNETDPDLVKMETDLYWIVKAGYDPIAFFNKNPGRCALWHVKDMDTSPEQMFTEVGNGTIDFKPIFDNQEKAGMKYYFIEQDQSEDPMKSIEISYKNLTEKILS